METIIMAAKVAKRAKGDKTSRGKTEMNKGKAETGPPKVAKFKQ